MEIHVQKCQKCGQRDVRNILVRDEEQKVYVQCLHCEALVARYIVRNGGYFHAGKEFESFLRSIERDGGDPSAKDLQEKYATAETSAYQDFESVLQELEQKANKKHTTKPER